MYQYCNGASAHRILLQPVTRYVAQSKGQMEETLTEYAALIRLVTRSKRATKELRSYVQHACAKTSQLCVTRSPWSDVVGQGSKYDYAVSVLPTDKRKSPRFTIDYNKNIRVRTLGSNHSLQRPVHTESRGQVYPCPHAGKQPFATAACTHGVKESKKSVSARWEATIRYSGLYTEVCCQNDKSQW